MGIDLTYEEREVLLDYLFRKLTNLKNAGLEDSKCYPLLQSAYYKIKNYDRQIHG